MTIPVWTRTQHRPTPAQASVMLVAFSSTPLDDGVAFSMSRFGAPTEASVRGLDIRTHAAAEDPGWFDGWRTGAIASVAATQLPDVGLLASAQYCHPVRTQVADPPDHAHLQAAWAAARWLVERGCFAVLDTHAGRWHDGPAVAALAPDRPFDLGAEITVVLETDETPGFGHAMHTRGMAKFARPDLMTAVTADNADRLAQVVHHLARSLADGDTVMPGQGVDVEGHESFTLVPYEPDVNAPQVHLNNDGYLLAPA